LTPAAAATAPSDTWAKGDTVPPAAATLEARATACRRYSCLASARRWGVSGAAGSDAGRREDIASLIVGGPPSMSIVRMHLCSAQVTVADDRATYLTRW